MTSSNEGIDFESLKRVLGEERALSLWSKAEIAKILVNRATELTQEIKTEIEFYSVIHGIENS